MKHFFLTLVVTFFCSIPLTAQQVSSLNIELLLLDGPTVTKMNSTCQYYNMRQESSKDSFEVYEHLDGSKICFKVDEMDGKKYPTVKVTTNEKSASISKTLSNCGYRATHNGYVKGTRFEHRRTKCRALSGPMTTLIFTKEYNSIE